MDLGRFIIAFGTIGTNPATLATGLALILSIWTLVRFLNFSTMDLAGASQPSVSFLMASSQLSPCQLLADLSRLIVYSEFRRSHSG